MAQDRRRGARAVHRRRRADASCRWIAGRSWRNPRDLTKIFQTPEYAAWRSLRESRRTARYIGLAMPRFLARLPYGAKTEPVEEFDFEEDTVGADSANYTWANSAYAMAVNINRSFKLYGWCIAHPRHRVAAARSRACRRTPSRPTTAAST